MPIARVLLVVSDRLFSQSLAGALEGQDFSVTTTESVSEALVLLSSANYQVLLSELHMSDPGDGLTVASAMRHANPEATTLLLSPLHEMVKATDVLSDQVDEILLKDMDVGELVSIIQKRLSERQPSPRVVEDVATILERSADMTIHNWYERVQSDESLTEVTMSYGLRCGHLPQVFHDLVCRLRSSEPLGTRKLTSIAAAEHGETRRKQGYTAAMVVEESRLLQVSIFESLQNNLATINHNAVLLGVMTITDEVDAQLGQAMESYMAESFSDGLNQ